MKHLKKMLALVLAICLCIGLMPATTMAATDTTEYLFFATDRHANTTIIGNIINNMENYIGENELDYLGLGGDMVGSGNSHPAYNSSTVLAEATGATSSLSADNVDIVAGIHDMNVTDDAGIVLPYQGGGAQIYEGKNYYVYGVEEYCISDDWDDENTSKEAHWQAQADAFVDWANGSEIDKSKAIFVLSHYPLHVKRNDNGGAVYWHNALNEVATGSENGTTVVRNVAFFHGHNHTVDSNEYFYNVGETMDIQGGNSDSTIYYTYATAGYLKQNSNATLVTINDSSIVYTKYGSSGSGTKKGEVTRVVTTTLDSISVSGVNEYSVGDKLELTVTASYSDGSTKDVTTSAEFSGYDMNTAGKYTVTVTYGEETATYDITVSEIQRTVTDSDDQVLISATSLGLTGIEIDNVTGTPDLSNSLDDYITYDVTLTNYTDGEEITYVMSLPYEMTTAGKTLYAVAKDGTLTELSYEPGVDEEGFATVTFKTTLTGMFAVGTKIVTIPSDAKLTSLEITSKPNVTKYFVATEDDVDDVAVNITGLVVEATYSNGTDTVTKELEWNRFDEIADGYSLLIDPKVIGPQTITVSYTYGDETCTDEFDITICYKTYTDDTNVQLDFTVASVTAVSVEENSDAEFVVNAMSGYGTNYVSYDIDLTGYVQGEKVTVTLPVPEEVKNPVVYYVSDNGNVVNNMNATNNGDGTVSFETDHFSTYVVNDEIETESGNATVEGTEDVTTTTKVAEEVTVYKLVATPESGKQYLIVNSNNGTGYGLDGDTTGYATTAFTGGLDYYSTWDDTTKTGTAFAAGSDVYLTTSGAYLWTAGSDSFGIGYDSDSSSSFGSTSYTYTLNPSGGTTGTWSLLNNRLFISLKTTDSWFGSDTNTTYYVSNSGSSWLMSTSDSNVYFYEPVTVYKVTEQEVTIPGDVGHTYSVEGTDITDALAIENQKVTLSSALYDTPESGTKTDITESSGLTPTYELVTTKGNPDVIAKGADGNYLIDGNVATLSGITGTAVVKVTYTYGDLVAWDEFLVTANSIPDEQYTITMHEQTTDADGNPAAGEEITAPITIKNIQNGMTASVWAVVKANGIDLGALGDKLTWTMSGDSIGTINPQTGVITFNGTEGTSTVTAYYTCPGGRVIQASVTYSVTLGNYTVPEDGTDDFPEYPEPGAVRFDKTAVAVGNFSETGIAQVELSMTGVPYGTDTAIDVVVMLDMTGSMSDNGMEAAEVATKAFVAKIVKNDDGTYNDNRVAVYAFNSGSSSPYELVTLGTIDNDSELETANTAIGTASDKQTSGGTPFDEAAEKCYDVLKAAKTDGTGNNRKQFCVFMSDGGPTTYYGSDEKTYYGGNNNSGDVLLTSCMTGYSSSDSSDWNYTLPTEYYTDAMKADGVTVYTVGLLLQTAPSNPAPYSSMTDSTYDSTTDSLTTIGSHYYFTSTILKNMASDTNKYIDIFNVDNASKATAAFENIAQSILDAATDVRVTDKIASDYTMVFEAPNTAVSDALPDGQEMYIEVKDYVLNPVYGTDGTTIVDYIRGSAVSLMKLYLGKIGSTYYAASDADGTAYDAPTFNQTAIGTMYYWTTTKTSSGVSVTVDGTTYYFDEVGMSNDAEEYVAANWYNMESGAYAFGNITTTDIVDSDTNTVTGENSICSDLIIATPYFVYNASTKMLTWTAAKLSTSELTLSYFLYLEESGGYSGAKDETDAGTYETNEYAYLSYTNFQNTDCQQTFPVPQMTWNGAQVSYVFYLVNDQGQPVNRAGKVVPFSEAVYVTDVFTYSIVWNDLEQMASLEAEYLAEELVPDVYELYDKGATYNIHVFEDEEGQNLNNHFVIGSGSNTYTTYVFNTKADSTKYKDPATYAATSSYKCKEYVANGQYTDDKGAYNIVTKTGATVVETGFDFSNTTVAFAVTWTPGLVEDTVVVDYGLDVLIDVIKNDNMAAGVVGVRTTAPSDVTTDGTYDRVEADTLKSVDLYIDANNDDSNLKELKIGTASVENLTSVRFSLDKTNGMQFNKPAEFYYEADVNYYVNNDLKSTSMYSKVTVIPATTVYYEDDFIQLASYTKNDDDYTLDSTSKWTTVGTTISATQDTDRPGASKISKLYDADNVYGYDSAYTECSEYSLGSASAITVDSSIRGEATFSFYGTGFDIVGLTSNTSGTLIVQVFDETGATVKSSIVNTYYGYAYKDGEWIVVDSNNPNALYQVPVMKIYDLTYGKYTVKLTAGYNEYFDETGDGEYTLYLDAIRIYDPCGSANETANNAYTADGEAYPEYTELRNIIISKNTFDSLNSESVSGIVFIDGATTDPDGIVSIADYTSYGPNNELYLAYGQAVAFDLNATATEGSVSSVQLAVKTVGGTGSIEVFGVDEKGNKTECLSETISTATDMYYDITALNGMTVVIKNAGDSADDAMVSLTNIKTTYTKAQTTSEEGTETASYGFFSINRSSASYAVASLSLTEEEDSTESGTTEDSSDDATNGGTTEDSDSTLEENTDSDVNEDTDSSDEDQNEDDSDDGTTGDTTDDTTEDDTAVEDTTTNVIVNFFKTIINKISNMLSKWFR